jgi:hypothetical protein
MKKQPRECQQHEDELKSINQTLLEIKAALIPVVKTVERHTAYWVLFTVIGSLLTVVSGVVAALWK